MMKITGLMIRISGIIRIMITMENDKNYENDDNNGNGGNCGNIANNGNDESSHTQLSSIVHKKELKMR